MLFLFDHWTDVTEREATKVWVENGIFVQRLASHEFGGEYKRNGAFYLCILWAVSLLAMITNSVGVFYRFLKKDKSSLWNAIMARDFKKTLKRFLIVWITACWEMGRDPKHISSFFVDRFSRYNHQAKWGAAGWKSLDVFYNYWGNIQPRLGRNLEGGLTRYWIERMENRQAVTNRLKIAINLLADALGKFANEPEIRFLSIASGSAQAVIGAIKKFPGLNIRVALIDADFSAINEAKRLVTESGMQNRFQFFHASTTILEEVCDNFLPHIVEMVGFLDYRSGKKAIELIGRIRNILPAGGIFVTCNIRKNAEKFFLDWVLLWPMIYRSPREFGELLIGGGFERERITLTYEPFEIHGIAVAVK